MAPFGLVQIAAVIAGAISGSEVLLGTMKVADEEQLTPALTVTE